ncbi:MAG: GMC family oxidoreductase [Nocardioidaceae bacterium]|nr:GMC family oxidoreductase [Nocardioidaceae bacterium]
MTYDYDVLVIGSGFGGSVAALRLVEKGYNVGVLEAGARFEDETLPTTSFALRTFLFAPRLGCYGIQRINVLRDCLILSGAGVGGGSLVYANVLYEPLGPFYSDSQWGHITDWRAELAPYFDQAKRMLGVVTYPGFSPSDGVMAQVAAEMGVSDTFRATPVGVFFGMPGQAVDDPYFGGAGPARRGCIECGECMTGCRHNAKNTLVKNYLHLAEAAGAQVHPLTTVTTVRPLPDGGYAVDTRRTDRLRGGRRRFRAEQVLLAAGALGTQRLLHRMRDEGELPNLSERLGVLTRTNSESLLGAVARGPTVDFSRGVAITSSFHPDEHTHVEPVRYGSGSNLMALLQTVLTDGDGPAPRWRTWLGELWRQRRDVRSLYNLKHWSERTVIALVMQSLDNSITTYTKRDPLTGRRWLTSRQGHGAPNPTWIPQANDAVRRMARIIGGTPGGNVGEQFNVPMTAHFIGGATIGDSPRTGVIDAYQRVYGHPGLHVVDGSAISANLGVNPSLTITAQAERAMALWPNRGETDPRPPLGRAYRRIRPVEPKNAVVPVDAPAALRLPIVAVS